VLNGPRYQLASDTVRWSLELNDGENCIRGVRFNNVVVDKLIVSSAPQAGHVMLHGMGFSYKAAGDFQGRDFFSLIVSGATNKVPGRSTIEVEVFISRANELRRFSTPSNSSRPSQVGSATSSPSPPPPINNLCGSSNDVAASSAPTTNLCSAGTASVVSGSGPWRWICVGSDGGTIAQCSAPLKTASLVQSGSGDFTFTPVHTYYMSPTGSDSNNGLTTSTPWATPNHSVVCGDVIIAAAGTYSPLLNWGTVSKCPSTSGGIDGAGGIYFAVLLCGGASVGDCAINDSTKDSMNIAASNWAVEGWKATSRGLHRSFQTNACASGTTILHHLAFINDISYDAADGYDTNECALNHNVPGNGTDYFAVVGSIAQNSAQDRICVAAIDDVGPAQIDSNPGTHVILIGNFAIANLQPGGCVSDGEGIMFDTWDAHGYTGQGVIEQNIVYGSERYGIQVFYQGLNSGDATMKVFNNTLFANNIGTNTNGGFASGDINVQSNTSSLPYPIAIYNNISQAGFANSGGAGTVYAALTGGVYNTTWGGIGIENIFKGLAVTCAGSSCDSGNNVTAFNGGSFGTNIYVDPSFKNTSDLLTHHVGVPNCSGFISVTACMGWNGSSATLLSVIDDLTPTAGAMTGKGYQPPGPCTSDPYYPTWLKGIVYLQASGFMNGATIKEKAGLVTKPCNL
jgi:hypothetical protein